MKISPACINNSLVNVSESLQKFAGDVKKEITGSSSASFDETSMPVNGKNAWVWTAVTNQSAFIAVEYSRGENVLEKHFREFDGVAVVDGWRAYGIFEKRQRCWPTYSGKPIRYR